MIRVMADVPVVAVFVLVQKQVLPLTSVTSHLQDEEEVPADLGDTRYGFAVPVMGLARIEYLECLAPTGAANRGDQRLFVELGVVPDDQPLEVIRRRHHQSAPPIGFPGREEQWN